MLLTPNPFSSRIGSVSAAILFWRPRFAGVDSEGIGIDCGYEAHAVKRRNFERKVSHVRQACKCQHRLTSGGRLQPTSIEPTAAVSAQARAHRRTWAALLARIFDLDGTLCPNCGGSMRLIAALTDEISIRHYLTGVGLAAVQPLIASARPPPQTAFEFAA